MVDVHALIEDLRAEQEGLAGLLAGLSPDDWATRTPAPGWDVTDQVAHLAFFDRAATTALTDEEAFARTLAEAAAAAAPAGEVADPAEPLPTQEVEELALPPEEDVSQPPETATPPADTQAEPSEPAPVAAVPSPPPRSGGRFLWPLQGEQVAAFGPQGDGRHNDGINIAAARGTTVVAAENGVVAYAGNELRGFGNLLLIKHSDDWITAYAHNDRLLVSAGDSVTRGQAIAEVGATGSVAQPQLHFEIRKGTRAVDPMPLLEGTGGG